MLSTSPKGTHCGLLGVFFVWNKSNNGEKVQVQLVNWFWPEKINCRCKNTLNSLSWQFWLVLFSFTS